MEFHQFQLLDFGIFDSRIKFPNITVTAPRPVDYYEIELLIGDHGGCSYIGDAAYPHSKIDFICAKPGQHRHSELPFKCYYLHLNAENETAETLLRSLPDTMEIGDSGEYAHLFSQMMRADFPDEDTKTLFLSSALSQILALALRDSNIGAMKNAVVGNKKALHKAEEYLIANFQRNVSLQELASVANISPIYFHKLFVAYFHKTPNQYLLDLRITHAKRKLLSEDSSLAGIALECGFTSQSYFCSRFKTATGLTPLQYRNAELSKVDI